MEAKTGRTLWENAEAKMTYGTPAVASVGGSQIVVTPNGDCVRAADGRILARKLASTTYTSPIVHQGVVYFIDASAAAFRLPEQPGDTIRPEKLWDSDDLEGEFFASPVYHEGMIYTVANEGTFYALEARTGRLVYKKELDLRSAGGQPGRPPANLYPSVTLAGKRLLVGNDAGETLVLQPGEQYKEAGRNTIDNGSGASFVPDGDRLFLRAGAMLYCIGSKR
jgi:outer membrane protein assembly factor BamB